MPSGNLKAPVLTSRHGGSDETLWRTPPVWQKRGGGSHSCHLTQRERRRLSGCDSLTSTALARDMLQGWHTVDPPEKGGLPCRALARREVLRHKSCANRSLWELKSAVRAKCRGRFKMQRPFYMRCLSASQAIVNRKTHGA